MNLKDDIKKDVQKIKKWWHSRLVWVGLTLASINFPDLVNYLSDNKDNWLPHIPEKWQHILTIALGVSVVVLRFKTTSAIGKSDVKSDS